MERNHIETPAPYSPSPDLLRRLREVDPSVDLHYVGEGRWALGSVTNNSVRRGIAGRIKRRLDRDGARTVGQYWLTQLHYRGFGFIEFYHADELHRAVTDFRRRDKNYRSGREAAFRRSERESEGAVKRRDLDEIMEKIAYREKHSRPELFRGRRHFPMGTLQ